MTLLGPALLFANFVVAQDRADRFVDIPENHAPYETIDLFTRDGLVRSIPSRLSRGAWPMGRTEFAQYTVEAVKNLSRASQGNLDAPESAVMRTAQGPVKTVLAFIEVQRPRFELMFKNFEPQFRAQGHDVVGLRAMLATVSAKVRSSKDTHAALQELRGGPIVPDSGATFRDYEAWRDLAVHWTDIPEIDCIDRYDRKASPTFTRAEFARMTIAVAKASSWKLKRENQWLRDRLARGGSNDADWWRPYLMFYESDWPSELRTLVKDFAAEIAAMHVDPSPLFKKAAEGEPMSRANAILCRQILGIP